MRKLLSNDYVVFVCRIILGLVFVVASVEKMADPAAFATSIGYYKLISHDIALVVATFLPWVELLSGMGLLFGTYLRGSSLLSLLMLVVFTAGIVSALARGLDISCGCFTQDPAVGKIGVMKVVENSALIILSIVLYYSRSVRFTVQRLPDKVPPVPGDTR